MITLLAGAALAYVLWRIGDEMQRRRREATLQHLMAMYGPAAAAAQQDPKQLIVWYPVAQTSRRLFPEAFNQLDAAAGGTFPFTREQLKAAHAKWTADWLAWERAHDAEYSVKTAEVQAEIDRVPAPAPPLLRTRLALIEQQKLERYQRRYEEYIKTAKVLAAFSEPSTKSE
jgi:hypothetical protein